MNTEPKADTLWPPTSSQNLGKLLNETSIDYFFVSPGLIHPVRLPLGNRLVTTDIFYVVSV